MDAPSKDQPAINQLLEVMAALRSPEGCPWDREQDHQSLRFHAVEEVYELIDAIEANDESEMIEELGDLLLQVIFHCQLGSERKAFDFDSVAQRIVDKLVHRHPHVFGDSDAKTVDAVWTQWEQLKKAEKAGTAHERESVLDGIPRHLPALQYVEKLVKKARKGQLLPEPDSAEEPPSDLGAQLFDLAQQAQAAGLSAEAQLREEIKKRETDWRAQEAN
ncbi:nucleoside triphosphate pyrophosphohydrolase [Candidatus Rhodobacter oscarellae]|uniref:nucleoside triphosphate pyrophosphohydrolase n=1 Tax=Candidatus Rhodobacter oscarellae TaxID=1675527 RepID=UPI000670E6FC|nr:MazG family protein [Candidatus Rhodobacter lobularis]